MSCFLFFLPFFSARERETKTIWMLLACSFWAVVSKEAFQAYTLAKEPTITSKWTHLQIFCKAKLKNSFSATHHLLKRTSFTAWWLNQPIWNICSSNWKSSPNRGEHKKYLSCHHLVYQVKNTTSQLPNTESLKTAGHSAIVEKGQAWGPERQSCCGPGTRLPNLNRRRWSNEKHAVMGT